MKNSTELKIKMNVKKLAAIIAITILVSFSAFAQVTLDLGRQSDDFGSKDQAAALLKLIESSPGQGGYQITYSTSIDTVAFGCDLDKNSIVRIHQRPNGTGTNERWQGHTLQRLRSAAQGGSLNDTPTGKSPGTFQTF